MKAFAFSFSFYLIFFGRLVFFMSQSFSFLAVEFQYSDDPCILISMVKLPIYELPNSGKNLMKNYNLNSFILLNLIFNLTIKLC